MEVKITADSFDSFAKDLLSQTSEFKGKISDALKASIFEIQKRTDDSGNSNLFQFKTPRALRTGMLARSFIFGVTFGDLYASIGPTVNYAQFVEDGTRRMQPNDYMGRIIKDATPDVEKHFEDLGSNFVLSLKR